MKVEFLTCEIEGVTGLDLAIWDSTATVLDLINAIQPWCDNEQIHKAYLETKRGACRGCEVNCCRECFVIPDLISFYQICNFLQLQPSEFIDQYIDPEFLSRGLPRLRSSPCIFLKEGLCTIYPYRTLICRLYICTPMTDEAQLIVYGVVAAGIGQFIRWLEKENLIKKELDKSRLAGYEKMLWELARYEADRLDNPFKNAVSYQEVPLRPLCLEDVWQVAIRKNKS